MENLGPESGGPWITVWKVIFNFIQFRARNQKVPFLNEHMINPDRQIIPKSSLSARF